MAIKKRRTSESFTQIPNSTLQDTSLSFEAKGLLVLVLSLPDDWEIHKTWLRKQTPKCGRDKLDRLLKELQDVGYMVKELKRNDDGTLQGYDWIIFDQKQLQTTDTNDSTGTLKTRTPVNPDSGKTSTTNKHINKQTTTTEKLDFNAFALALLEILQEMISEGGWIPEGYPAPKKTWLKAKAETLYGKLPDPRPEDCALIILKDWAKQTQGSSVAA